MSSQRSNWRERLHANPSRMEQELAFKLQDAGIHYQTQVQMAKDEELRSLLRKRGYRVLELCYDNYTDYKRDQLYDEIRNCLVSKAGH